MNIIMNFVKINLKVRVIRRLHIQPLLAGMVQRETSISVNGGRVAPRYSLATWMAILAFRSALNLLIAICEQAHKVLGSESLALKLYAVEQLPGGWYIVVMEDLRGSHESLFSHIQSDDNSLSPERWMLASRFL